LTEYDTVSLQYRSPPFLAASLTIVVVVVVVLTSVDSVAVWIAGAVDRHTATSSETQAAPPLGIVNATSLSLQTAVLLVRGMISTQLARHIRI